MASDGRVQCWRVKEVDGQTRYLFVFESGGADNPSVACYTGQIMGELIRDFAQGRPDPSGRRFHFAEKDYPLTTPHREGS